MTFEKYLLTGEKNTIKLEISMISYGKKYRVKNEGQTLCTNALKNFVLHNFYLILNNF